MSRLVVLDGNAIIHRAYHAIPPLTTKEGLVVNAVYGFASMLLRVWRELKPEYVAVTFDVAGGTFRHAAFKPYKATRVKADQALYDQIPLVHELVAAFGLSIYEKKGYEADDVIGTIVAEVEKTKPASERPEVFIVTGDMDTLQLVQPTVKVFTLRKGLNDTVIYDPAAVQARFGFGPERLIDYKALAGDSSDNIPGVKGVGEKTAVELIKKFGTIEALYEALRGDKVPAGTIKPGMLKKLLADEEGAKMSKYLATIDRCVPELHFKLADCRLRPFAGERIVALFQRFEFTSLLKRIPEIAVGGAAALAANPAPSKNAPAKAVIFRELTNKNEADNLVHKIKKSGQWYCREVVEGKDFPGAKLKGVLVVTENQVEYAGATFLPVLAPLFADPGIELSGHDLKQLVKGLLVNNVAVKNQLFDVMIASYLLNPGSRAHDPASIALKVLGTALPTSSSQESLFGFDPRALSGEVALLAKAVAPLKKELAAIDDYGLIAKIEAPVSLVLAEMELNGVAVDRAKLGELSVRVAADIKKVTKEIYELSGAEFNIASPLQLREVLFDKMGLPTAGVKKGKTGLSTSAEELEKLHDLHPIIARISEYRELCKLQNTYIDVLPTLINAATGRIHTHFNQAVAATGRLSSTDPNLQNIPVRTPLGREIRTAFIAEPGNVLVSADYSQIELRIVASLAEDAQMLDIFSRDEDIHQATAAAINDVAPEKVTKEMRYAAKEINFGVLYGMGTYGLSWRAGIPHWQAKEFIEKYFQEFAGVKKYIDRTLAFTKKEGYCETLFGRRRYLPELASSNYQLRAGAERMAVNHPIQGTAADLMKLAMIEVHNEITKLQNPAIKMILQVHDELVLEIPKNAVSETSALLKKTMEGVVKLRVPVKVEVKTGHNWGEMEK